jgi:hypothetical protein
MNWRYFIAAALSVAIILIVNGVPLLPVVIGCGVVAIWNFRKKLRSQRLPSYSSK